MRSIHTLNAKIYGGVVELVDTHALGACAARREGSSPFSPTSKFPGQGSGFLFVQLFAQLFVRIGVIIWLMKKFVVSHGKHIEPEC